MKRFTNSVFFIIAQDFFQLTPLWKPQILLKQIYTGAISIRFLTLKKKPADWLVYVYLLTSLVLISLQLYTYSIAGSQFAFFDLLRSQYPLVMAFSILMLLETKTVLHPQQTYKLVFVLTVLNVAANLGVAVFGLEEAIASSYDVFEFSFNQNVVIFFIFIQASSLLYGSTNRNLHLALFLGAFCLINFPNFQRSRLLIIGLILLVTYFRRVSYALKLGILSISVITLALLFRTEKFSSLLEAFVSKEDAIDPALAGRFIQTQQILSADFNPWIGFGFLNTKTKDDLFGEDYFHPSDTGLFGVYFNGGYLGLIMILLLCTIAIREIRRARKRSASGLSISSKVIVNASVMMVCYILINSLFTGATFYEPMFLVSYLYLLKFSTE